MVEQATVIGGRAMRLQAGPFLVLPIHAVETNSRAPLGARVTPQQAEEIQTAARRAAIVTGMITEEQIERRILPLAIFPQSVNPEVAAISIQALRVLVEISPDKRSMEMGYWRSWLANQDRRKALAASAALAARANRAAPVVAAKTEGAGVMEAEEGPKAEGGEQKPDEAALCGGGMHGKKVTVLLEHGYCVALLTTVEAKKKAAEQAWETQTGQHKPDWAGLVADAEKDGAPIARMYLYKRKADGSFDCVERWPAKAKK